MINTRLSTFVIVCLLTCFALMSVAWSDDKFSRSVNSALDKRTRTPLPSSSNLRVFSADWYEAGIQASWGEPKRLEPSDDWLESKLTPFDEQPSVGRYRWLLENRSFLQNVEELTKDRQFVADFDKTFRHLKRNNLTYKNFSRDEFIQHWIDAAIIINQAKGCNSCLCIFLIWCGPPPDSSEDSSIRSLVGPSPSPY